MRKNQSGFGIFELLALLTVIIILGLVAWRFMSSLNKNQQATSSNAQDSSTTLQPSKLIWQQTAEGWQSMETPPKCSEQPMLKAPADISKATSILYPGQNRGQYKPHGGLRFDNNADNTLTVTAPIDGYIVKASRFLAQGTTELQYTYDIMNNCGIMTRIGHLREVPSEMQKIFDKLPEASSDSLMENVNPPVYVKQGDILATKTGLISEKNVFFDWGIYDYRQQNEASKSADYQLAHPQKELAWYAVCWLRDWLPQNDEATLSVLPAGGGENGKASDYCQ